MGANKLLIDADDCDAIILFEYIFSAGEFNLGRGVRRNLVKTEP